MTLMPGIKSDGEFGSDINVRGGGSDQNLILIEGTPVFNTAHVFGLLSAMYTLFLKKHLIFTPFFMNNCRQKTGYLILLRQIWSGTYSAQTTPRNWLWAYLKLRPNRHRTVL